MLANKNEDLQLLDMEACQAGVRMVRYFDWRESTLVAREDTSDGENPVQRVVSTNDDASNPNIPPTCAREVHSLWGCRAVSLACSSHVKELRTCFQQYDKETVLSVPYFGYQEGVDEDRNIPCKEIQRSLGKCVAQKANELEERITTSRRQAEEESSQATD